MTLDLKNVPLGNPSSYAEQYDPTLLCPVSRTLGRNNLAISKFPFHGTDIWNAYEISWLNPKGKPEVAIGEFEFPYDSPNIVESKSFKLYLNSFNQSKFESLNQVESILQKDLSKSCGSEISVKLIDLSSKFPAQESRETTPICIDNLDIEISEYETNPGLLSSQTAKSTTQSDVQPNVQRPSHTSENIYSKLLKSNCLVTGQPDWAHIQIKYEGPAICHESLLKYIISYRRHQGFHEHCVESIFCDILERCKPEKLTVYARYTRRGGLDINPFRSNFENLNDQTKNIKHAQQ